MSDRTGSTATKRNDRVADPGTVPVWRRLSFTQRERVRSAVYYGLLLLVMVVVLFPLYWMFQSSLRPTADMVVRDPNVVPEALTLDHYRFILGDSDFLTFYTNTFVVAVGVIVLTTVLSTLGGYGLTRLDIPYKRTFARGILFGYMFPAILLAIPMFIFWRQLGIINSYLGLILAETALSLPFSLWLMWRFFQSVPVSLEESARVAGASRFRTLVDIALPMAKPGMVAVALFSFAVSWSQYTMPKILMPQAENYVLTIGIESLIVYGQVQWGRVMAASFLAIVPALLFTYFLQKYFLEGFRAGGTT